MLWVWFLVVIFFGVSSILFGSPRDWSSRDYDELYRMAAQRKVHRRAPSLAGAIAYLKHYRSEIEAYCRGPGFENIDPVAEFLDTSVREIREHIDRYGIRRFDTAYLATTVRSIDKYFREKGIVFNAAQEGRMYPSDWRLVWGLRRGCGEVARFLGDGPIDFEPTPVNLEYDRRDRRWTMIEQAIKLLPRSGQQPCNIP